MIAFSQLLDKINSLKYQVSTVQLTKEILAKLQGKNISLENFLKKLFLI